MAELTFTQRREGVRKKIDDGQLPNTAKVVRDEGTSHVKQRRCSVCGGLIEPDDCQYAITASGPLSDRQTYGGLCFLCHAAWQLEVAGV